MDEKKLQEILDYYGANLDNSGEPDEMPEFEGVVTFPTVEEAFSRNQQWAQKVQSWNKDGGENS